MVKIVSRWKSAALGVSYLVAVVLLQAAFSALAPEHSWPQYSILLLLLLAPVAFVPFVGRIACMFYASLATVFAILMIGLVGSFFQDEYSSTGWGGIMLMISIILAGSVFFAWPILHFKNKRLAASEPQGAVDTAARRD